MSTTLQTIGTRIRAFLIGDFDQIMQIEAAQMNRWSETCMLEQLRNESNEMLVIECNRRVLGYCLYEERKHSFRVLRFAVRTPNCGLGRMLMKNMHRRCLTEGKNRIDVSVDETEVGVQLFLSRVGFTAIGISGDQINFRHLRGDRC